MLVGERRAPALVIGVRNFARQGVDVVRLASGAYPGPGEVLTEVQNANVGVYDARAGDIASVVGAGGLRITGEGRNIPGGEEVQDEIVIVLYASLRHDRCAGRRARVRPPRHPPARYEPRRGNGGERAPLPRDSAGLRRLQGPAGASCSR